MICPNKICQKEILNDSIFCDQCGIHLSQCPKCGTISVSKFCNVCGELVVARKISDKDDSSKPESDSQSLPTSNSTQNETTSLPSSAVPQEPKDVEPSGTIIIEEKTALKIVHPDFVLEINSGDILGRTTGPHSGKLGKFNVISSKHAKIEEKDDGWYFTDLHSSNKSYLNGKVLSPDVSFKLNDNDKLTLANVNFMVNIK